MSVAFDLMISDLDRFDSWNCDKVKRATMIAEIEAMGLLQAMKNTIWLTCTRLLFRVKESEQLEQITGFAADAMTSREAVEKKSHDGGREGWFKKMKPVFGKLCTSVNSLEKCDGILERLGVVRKHHNGRGLVAHNEINIRSLVLLLEALHPSWDEIPKCFVWLKAVCDKILERPFNRFDWAQGEYFPADTAQEMLEQYEETNPLLAIAPESLSFLLAKSFYRFCVRKTKEYAEKFWVGFTVDDYWLGIGDPCID